MMTTCDICERTVFEDDVLCDTCREAITRLEMICHEQPELLASATFGQTLDVETGAAVAASPAPSSASASEAAHYIPQF